MLEKGIVEPSSSDWASSPVLVRKKDGSLRYCIDFRALNSVTVRDAIPLLDMSDCIESLKGSICRQLIGILKFTKMISIRPF